MLQGGLPPKSCLLTRDLMQMTLTINGERHTFEGPLTVAGLLVRLGLDPQKLAVEHNLEIVPRSTYDQVAVKDGDRLELVQFVGGG